MKAINSIKLNVLFLIRRYTYIGLWVVSRLALNHLFTQQVLVICYHSISDGNWRFGVSYKEFKKQIKYLQKHYDILTPSEFESFISGKKQITRPSILITFDDGYKDILIARKFLNQNNIKPILFMLADTKGTDREELDNTKDLLSKREVSLLKKDGWTIGSHGATHADFWNLKKTQISYEIASSQKILKKEFKNTIKYFAYPKGRYTKEVLSALKKSGYTLGFSMNDGFIKKDTPKLLIPRVGVDRSHTDAEFKAMLTPGAIYFRKVVRNLGLGAIMN